MKKNLLFALFVIFFSSPTTAQYYNHEDNFNLPDVAETPLKEVSGHPEIYQHSETLMGGMDSNGVPRDPHYSAKEKSRLSIAGQIMASVDEHDGLAAFDVTYLRRLESYDRLWWGAQFKQIRGKYSALADELSSDSGHTDGNANTSRGGNTQSITTIGVGVGYRFKLLTDFNSSGKFFEHIMAFANYVMHKDATDERTYRGYGLNSEYGIFYHTGYSSFIGLKLSYAINSVARPAISDEKLPDRSLILSWTALGAEFGYYF